MHHFSIANECFIRGTILRLFFGTTILHNSSWSGLPFAFWIEKGGRCDPFSLHQTRVTVYAFLCVPVVQGNFRMPPVWEMLWNGQRRFVHSGSCGCVSASDKSTTITLYLILLSKKSPLHIHDGVTSHFIVAIPHLHSFSTKTFFSHTRTCLQKQSLQSSR